MNKKLLGITLGISLVIIGAIVYVLLMPPKESVTQYEPAITMPSTPLSSDAPTEPATSSPQPGQYIPYSADAVRSTPGTKLLFFHAPWCPQCREIEASITTRGLPDGVTVFKIDYDSNQALRQQYGVTIQTTFVKVDDSGVKLASYVAYGEPQFSSVQRELLP